jgi:ribose 5-phosphate isomerase B
MSKKIAIGGDHAGFELKNFVRDLLIKEHDVKDFGPFTNESVDYPDFAHPLSEAVEKGEFDLGILVCGSGNGVCMTANKHKGIRAALAWNEELASLARQHNNANVLCLAGRFIDKVSAEKIVKAFLSANFEGGRHETRVNKI